MCVYVCVYIYIYAYIYTYSLRTPCKYPPAFQEPRPPHVARTCYTLFYDIM